MSDTPQKRALKNYRKRLNQRGIARFEVLGLDADRRLIRSLATRLCCTLQHLRRPAEDGRDTQRLAPVALNMIVAAIAEANGCTIVTGNERDFAGLKILNPLRAAN